MLKLALKHLGLRLHQLLEQNLLLLDLGGQILCIGTACSRANTI